MLNYAALRIQYENEKSPLCFNAWQIKQLIKKRDLERDNQRLEKRFLKESAK